MLSGELNVVLLFYNPGMGSAGSYDHCNQHT